MNLIKNIVGSLFTQRKKEDSDNINSGNVVNGNQNTIVGNTNISDGDGNINIGSGNEVNGKGSITIGNNNKVG